MVGFGKEVVGSGFERQDAMLIRMHATYHQNVDIPIRDFTADALAELEAV